MIQLMGFNPPTFSPFLAILSSQIRMILDCSSGFIQFASMSGFSGSSIQKQYAAAGR